MNIEMFDALMDSYEDDFLEFEKIENKRSLRPDLHAFLLLDELVPGTSDMVAGARHDEIHLEVDLEKVVEVITEEQILELVRCGVMCHDESLMMFV